MVIINYYQILGGDPYAGIFKVIKIMEEVVSLLSFQRIDKVILWEKKKEVISCFKHLMFKEDGPYKAVEFAEWGIIYTKCYVERLWFFELFKMGFIIFTGNIRDFVNC